MQAFPHGISQIPGSNQKPEHLHFKAVKGSREHSFSSYVLQSTELDGERVPKYVYLSLKLFNQWSSKLVLYVFSVNWFILSFRFQRMLEAPSKDMVYWKTHKTSPFFKMFLSATCEIPHLHLSFPREQSLRKWTAPTNHPLWNYRPFNWENLKDVVYFNIDLVVPSYDPTTIVSAVTYFGCHFLLYFLQQCHSLVLFFPCLYLIFLSLPSSKHQLQMQCFLSQRCFTLPSPTETKEPEASLHHHKEHTSCHLLHTRKELSMKCRKTFPRDSGKKNVKFWVYIHKSNSCFLIFKFLVNWLTN